MSNTPWQSPDGRERLWLSPHCLTNAPEPTLFEAGRGEPNAGEKEATA